MVSPAAFRFEARPVRSLPVCAKVPLGYDIGHRMLVGVTGKPCAHSVDAVPGGGAGVTFSPVPFVTPWSAPELAVDYNQLRWRC